MVKTRALLDTNIIIDLLNGVPQSADEVSYYSDVAVSAITLMELAVGCIKMGTMPQLLAFINTGVQVIHTDHAISMQAAQIRAAGLAALPKRNIKLPDAIIGATANVSLRTLVTRNPRDFGASAVRVPYQIVNGKAGNIASPPP
ncbi:PIN domain-containing protein [Duganella levis]|uniref:PIN domain-containing protein n=1 Tax=Duganella levis TaxID=2692169 RepID=A0ABW9VZM8_9BURK|nr:PIN domain-containing protein [Duganella levis]MYN27085.1 PIN domain-containing protein [Duganella levis]